MILIDFPTPSPISIDLDLICPELRSSNLIAFLRSEPGWSPATQGTLSIKCAFGGEETYLVDRHRMAVGNGKYLILNEGQRYASEVAPSTIAKSLVVFFRPGFAGEVLRSLVEPDDRLLNDPEQHAKEPVYFMEQIYPQDTFVTPALKHIHDTLSRQVVTRGWLEEQFHDLLPRMLRVHRDVMKDIARLPVVRRSSRIEIYRRLTRARDFMHAAYGTPIGLSDMAREARMAPHHFLRMFKHAFNSTPHQYLTQLRLEQARTLLATTSYPITQICFEVGFESPTSFALLFRRHEGVSPKAFRARANETRNFR